MERVWPREGKRERSQGAWTAGSRVLGAWLRGKPRTRLGNKVKTRLVRGTLGVEGSLQAPGPVACEKAKLRIVVCSTLVLKLREPGAQNICSPYAEIGAEIWAEI